MITEYKQCWYCQEMYVATDKLCPVCRRKPQDKSGAHVQAPQPIKIPIYYEVPKRIVVRINRGEGAFETLQLNCIGESNTHFHGYRETSQEFGPQINEWFAKHSARVRTVSVK